jgi:hypothetical protein
MVLYTAYNDNYLLHNFGLNVQVLKFKIEIEKSFAKTSLNIENIFFKFHLLPYDSFLCEKWYHQNKKREHEKILLTSFQYLTKGSSNEVLRTPCFNLNLCSNNLIAKWVYEKKSPKIAASVCLFILTIP